MKTPSPSPHTKWIWTAGVRANSYIAAVRTLDLVGPPQKAAIRLTADAKYKLYVDGRFVNAGPCPFRKPVVWVDQYDITPYLLSGVNRIAIIAHFIGTTTKYNTVERPGIWAELSIEDVNGQVQWEGTGPAWQVADLRCWNADTPKKNWALEHLEDLDLAHADFALLAQLASDDYGGSETVGPAPEFEAPQVEARPELEYRSRQVPELKWQSEHLTLPSRIFRGNTEVDSWQNAASRFDHEHVWPEWEESCYEMGRSGHLQFERRTGESGFLLLYDFGRLCAGDPAVELYCERACTLDLAFAENLTSDGRPKIWRSGNLYMARYHLQPGLNRVRLYHFNSFRYLYLVFKDAVGKVEVRRVTTHHCRANLTFQDKFRCPDRTAEALYRICRRSFKLNAQALPYDCNSREQGAYWGDNLWIVESLGHLTRDFSHFRHLCYAATDEYKQHGPYLPANLYGVSPLLYDYSLVPPQCLWKYYLATADVMAVADNLDTMRAIVAAFRELKNDDGLLELSNLPADKAPESQRLLFLDHPGPGWHPMTTVAMDRSDINAGFNLFYLQALQALGGLERALGHPAVEMEQEAAALTATLRGLCFRAEVGLVADAIGPDVDAPTFSQLVNALAVTTGLLQGQEADEAMRLVLDIPRHPWISQGTPYSYFFLAEAAGQTRVTRLALEAFLQAFRPMLERGATTTWETWRAEHHDSLNHAWSSSLPHLIWRALLGMEPLVPGYQKVKLQPQLEVLDQVSMTCCLPGGQVSVEWERCAPRVVDLNVTLPANTEAELHLPDRLERLTGNWQGRVTLS